MFHPKAIANEFLRLGYRDNIGITPMMLTKLVYIAHGWHLALVDKELINEYAQAWRYGPVIPSLYHEFKKFGHQKIDKPATRVNVIDDQVVKTVPRVDDKSIVDFIENVWSAYKQYDGSQLSSLTHQRGTPWHTAWHDEGGSQIMGTSIRNDLIKKYYKGLHEKRNKPAAR